MTVSYSLLMESKTSGAKRLVRRVAPVGAGKMGGRLPY